MRDDVCLEPGVQDDGCPAGTTGMEDGSCAPAGIGPDLCSDGFLHDGDVGCAPVLPEEPCRPGTMAIPGDPACRPVWECGSGTWGSLETDATTEHVDISYAGTDSDGSALKPWTRISDAVAAAAPGALVAIAAGSYAEDVLLANEIVRLWGVCPERVEIVGTGTALGTIDVRTSGSEVGGVAVTGPRHGVSLRGSDLILDRVWIHDNVAQGIHVESTPGPAALVLKGSLVEGNHQAGVVVLGAKATIEASVIRGTLPSTDHSWGSGLVAASHLGTLALSTVVVRGSVIEDNRNLGVDFRGANLDMEASVVRRTRSQALDDTFGDGVLIMPDIYAQPSSLVLRGSLVAENQRVGVLVLDSSVEVDTTVVRDNLPETASQLGGRGINIDTTRGATVKRSLLEANHDMGMQLVGSEIVVESVVVRGTRPNPNMTYGWALSIRHGEEPDPATSATVRGSVFERHQAFAIGIQGSDVALAGVLVRDVAPTVDDRFGDAITIWTQFLPTNVFIDGSLIEQTPRAGISNFGAFASFASTALRCHGFEIEGEPYTPGSTTFQFAFEDRGHNACGCPTASAECVAVSAGLEPPVPAETLP